jgi:hypothetical protein
MIGCRCDAGAVGGRCAFCGASRPTRARRGTNVRDVASSPATEVGFMVTPGAIADRIAAIDAAVQALAKDVDTSASPKLGAQWRAEFHAFVRRWQVARDARAGWTSRLFNYDVGPEIDAFQNSLTWWARDFEKKGGRAPTVPPPAPVEGPGGALIPDEVWWIAGGLALVWVLTSAAEIKALAKLAR